MKLGGHRRSSESELIDEPATQQSVPAPGTTRQESEPTPTDVTAEDRRAAYSRTVRLLLKLGFIDDSPQQ
jgi:hypothetical protein